MTVAIRYHTDSGQHSGVILRETPTRVRVAYLDKRVRIRWVPISERKFMTELDNITTKQAVAGLRSAYWNLNLRSVKHADGFKTFHHQSAPAELSANADAKQ